MLVPTSATTTTTRAATTAATAAWFRRGPTDALWVAVVTTLVAGRVDSIDRIVGGVCVAVCRLAGGAGEGERVSGDESAEDGVVVSGAKMNQ